ncbi:hypothetical protein PsorP6_017460 [Peronosclerospora sorghi]|uniref:Uncharacterized protein n=1 Tax=Peronosclerospora sorghi TaxID=230839 RepID=A0ACC0WN51_9STRA|nr:hypothetical protein PsorP6_017460 [Peronosclerospora sorghi]
MLFLQQDVRLFCVVFMVTAMLVVNFLCTLAGKHAKLWGEGSRLKLAAYVTFLIYWVFWRGEWADTLRMLGPEELYWARLRHLNCRKFVDEYLRDCSTKYEMGYILMVTWMCIFSWTKSIKRAITSRKQ